MTDYNPIFHSPITIPDPSTSLRPGPQSPSSPLTLSDLTGAPVTLIQGEAAEALQKEFGNIPQQPGDLVDLGEGLLACLTPTEFYLFGKSPAADLPSTAALDDALANTDLTHGKAVLRLVGLPAAELLSKICGLDVRDTAFPNLRAAQTSAAKIKTLIARYDEGETLGYFLHVERPLGQYFWDIVWEAGLEFGIGGGL